MHAGNELLVELADLSSEERRDLVVSLPVAAGPLGERLRVVDVEVSWTDARSGRADGVRVTAEVVFVTPGEADAPDPAVREATVLQRSAAAMRRATAFAERGDYGTARAVLLEAALEAKDVPTEHARTIAETLVALAHDFGGEHAFTSSRSRRTSLHRSMSKQRGSGSVLDDLFLTAAQQRMRETFADAGPQETPPAKPRAR